MKRNAWLYGGIALLFAAIGIFFGLKHAAPPTPASQAVAALFARPMEDTDGKMQTLSHWQGKILVVNFWAPWCAPCVQEMPELSTLQTELKHIQILGIGIDTPANIRSFAARYAINYPLYSAGLDGTELAAHLGDSAGGLPFTVIIGADGAVKKTYLGRLQMAQLRADLASL